MISFRIEDMLNIINRLKDWFSLDTRSLAVARMGLGFFIAIDMLWRMGSAEWHYSDIGSMPRDVFLSQFSFPWSFSLHMANGTWIFAVFMFALHGFCALSMAVGWRTRLMTFMTALLTISLHNRNWYVNNGGDDILRSILLLATFIPWGEMWSVDQWKLGQGALAPRRVRGAWVIAWFFQVFVIYFVSYLLKTSPIWRVDYTAIYYSSHLNIFSTAFGRFIRDYPLFMKGATFATIMLEWLGPLALAFAWVLPRKSWIVSRTLIVVAFWGLHLGIIATMKIGLFPFYCLAMWAAFLPTEGWDAWLARLPVIEAKLRAFFARLAGTPTLVRSGLAEQRWPGYLSQGLGLFVLTALVFWNLSTLKPPLKVTVPFWLQVTRNLHLYQEWNMFAPFPKQENLWIEMPAELEDGTPLELMTGDADVLSSKEHTFPDSVRDEHWRKYLMNLADNDKLARHYAGAWCRMWNRPVENGGRRPRLRKLSINIYHTMIGLNYQHSEVRKKNLWNHWCFAEDLKQSN